MSVKVPLVPDVAAIVDDDIEIHTWPPERRGGQHVSRYEFGVLAIHKPTGLAFVSTYHRSQLMNRQNAISKLKLLVAADKHGLLELA